MFLLAEAPLTKQCGRPSRGGGLSWTLGLCVTLLIGCGAPEPSQPTGPTVTVLSQGGPLHGTNGVLFGPDGRLYVASISSPAVVALDPESGAILERWGPEEGVKGPDDLAFGPVGSLCPSVVLVTSSSRLIPRASRSPVRSVTSSVEAA